jgi:hypothetical protein
MNPVGSGGPAPRSTGGERASDLLELADALMERARALAAQSDQLIAALDAAARRLVESGRGVEVSPLPAPVRLLQRPATPEVSKSANGSAEAAISDGARYLIIQMANAGSDHDEIAKRLREEFGMADADEVLQRAGL